MSGDARVSRVAGATRHDEESGWYQKNESNEANLVLTFMAREQEEKAVDEEEKRRRR